MKNESFGTIFLIVVFTGIVVISVFYGYLKIMVRHDFPIFTSESETSAPAPSIEG